jgi:hypothetical protein
MGIGIGIGIGIGSPPGGGGGSPPGDTTPPGSPAAATNAAGTTITITLNEALDTGSQSATSAFSLGGTASTVASLNVTGSTIVLTLNTPAYRHEIITVTYVVPGVNPIQDLAGNDAAPFAGLAVTNNIDARAADPVAIIGSSSFFCFFSADLGITLVTGVSAWADQTGHAANGAQASGTAQPTHLASDPAFGGRGSVTGDGSNDRLVVAWDPPLPGTTNLWMFAVFRQLSWTANDTPWSGGSTFIALTQLGSSPNLAGYNGNTGGNNAGAPIGTAVRSRQLFGNTIADYLRLGATHVTGIALGNLNAAEFDLFSRTNAQFANCAIACFGVCNGEPTTAKMNQIDDWVTAYHAGAVAVG